MNQGLRQRIFKSGFVIAGGREGEQMLRSFNHACHARDCSLAAELTLSTAAPLPVACTFSGCLCRPFTWCVCVCVCVAEKIHLASGTNLSQVVEDPITVVTNVTTNCQATHTPRRSNNEEEMCVLISSCVCVCNTEN